LNIWEYWFKQAKEKKGFYRDISTCSWVRVP
jgi:hypothetical protein